MNMAGVSSPYRSKETVNAIPSRFTMGTRRKSQKIRSAKRHFRIFYPIISGLNCIPDKVHLLLPDFNHKFTKH